MEISPYGAAGVVTGSCYTVREGNDKIIVDCGMFQGNKELEKLNYGDIGFEAKPIKALLLTHAHLDHCGRIPKLVKYGFRGKIYTTAATRDLAYVVMMDSAKIAGHDISWENVRRKKQGLGPREPIYTTKDVDDAIKLFVPVKYGEVVKVSKTFSAKFYDAGHILGAACIQVMTKNNTVVFSGDVGQANTPIVCDPEKITKADYVFMESTYGDRLHPPIKERRTKLLRIIKETYKRRGKLLIPSFAIERAQELLHDINDFVEAGLMPKIPVYLDSPMAIKATEVFKKHPEVYDKDVRHHLEHGDDPFTFPKLIYSNTVDDSKSINEVDEPCVIIAGSGMCNAGRIKHHIANHIEDPKNTILFVGYQSHGTLGYWIKKGEKNIRLLGQQKQVNAHVESIDSYSAHADYKGLISWLSNFAPKPRKVFLIHGEERSMKSFSKRLKDLGYTISIPKLKEKIILSSS